MLAFNINSPSRSSNILQECAIVYVDGFKVSIIVDSASSVGRVKNKQGIQNLE